MTDRDGNGRFVAGNRANPGGRPKSELNITTLIDDAVTVDDWKFIFETLKKKARRGDMKAIEMLMDRRFGKPKQSTEITGADGAPIQVQRIEVVLPPEDGDGNT